MTKPQNAKGGCFSDFFHLIFGVENGNSPPMYISNDHITKSQVTEAVHPNEDNEAKPGVVARLMGLDSLPNTKLEESKGKSTPDLVPRSRSVNFVDYLLKFDINQNNQLKTSASFREVPALYHHKNNDLVVLYWDSKSEDHKVGSFLGNQEMGLGEYSRKGKKQGSKNKEIVRKQSNMKKDRNDEKNKKNSKFKNEPRVVPVKHGSNSKGQNHNEIKVLASVSACSKNCSNRKGGSSGSRSSSTMTNKQKKVVSESKHKKNIRKQESSKKIETECSSQNFSSISVLDDNDYSFLYGPDFIDYSSPLMSKPKSSELLFLDDNVEGRTSKDKGYAYPDIKREKGYFSELIVKLCKLTENDVRESFCTQMRACETETFEEICLACEHKIFDILLNEVVNELV
ncbi:hypothetical protein VNO77_20579 [Canavalia gladiata]|uniref:DUF3741 domain-containing protein n=1 Tax=Canavalia gladiata TaxID=3824 RepID=A0AAN9LUL7_CANGL